MDNLDGKEPIPVFPRYPDGSVFTAYRVNQKEIKTVEFDCIRYQNLLTRNLSCCQLVSQ